MKKSDMIKIIKDTLLEWDNEVIWDVDHEKLAEDILDSIENAGVLPPLNENNYHCMDHEDRKVCNLAKTWYYKWEEE